MSSTASGPPPDTFWAALRRPPADHLLCRLERIYHDPATQRSPVLFIHGFPDSPAMFRDYSCGSERSAGWLHGRSIYSLAFPNRHNNLAALPSLTDLRSGRLSREFAALVDIVIAASPTGRIVLVAHDWGATYSWQLIRRRPDLPIEAMISLSVGSSFRYDLGEHGPQALSWLYSSIFGLPYYLPFPAVRRILADSLTLAGYQSATIERAYQDSFHYWDWPLRALLTPLRLLGLHRQPAFTDIRFPVLYIRTAMDRIATTSDFEVYIGSRSDCRVIVHEDLNHWFPEQHSDLVLSELRRFPALQAEE